MKSLNVHMRLQLLGPSFFTGQLGSGLPFRPFFRFLCMIDKEICIIIRRLFHQHCIRPSRMIRCMWTLRCGFTVRLLNLPPVIQSCKCSRFVSVNLLSLCWRELASRLFVRVSRVSLDI